MYHTRFLVGRLSYAFGDGWEAALVFAGGELVGELAFEGFVLGFWG